MNVSGITYLPSAFAVDRNASNEGYRLGGTVSSFDAQATADRLAVSRKVKRAQLRKVRRLAVQRLRES